MPAGVGLAGLLMASAAEAQTKPAATPASPPPPPSTPVQGVTVKADAPPVKSSIDRRSYSVAGDLQAATGSIADALKKIPSVEVDIDGNVKLRGDSSVTILIDGKPSAIMKGGGRADALAQIPADQIERVEVLTNPGADVSPEGTGGVINLVTKKAGNAGAGVSGSVRGVVGTNGRYNAGLNWSYNSKTLSASAGAAVSRYGAQFTGAGDRTLGSGFRRRSDSRSQSNGTSGFVQMNADYELDPRNRVSGGLTWYSNRSDSRSEAGYQNFDPLGALTEVSGRSATYVGTSSSTTLSLNWRRDFAGEDHNFTLDLNRSLWDSDNTSFYRYYALTPAGPDRFEDSRSASGNDNLTLKGDYKRPMPGEARLKAGFELQINQDDEDDRILVGPSRTALVFDPARSHRLIFDETVAAAYVSYERPFGDLTVLLGLRYESATDELSLVTTGLKTSHTYEQFYPTLHLDYRLSDTMRLKASYSLRIARPDSGDLDPFLYKIDAYNYWQGNPDLEPSKTRSWEASWEYRQGRSYTLVTGFWRETDNGVTERQVDLGGGVLLSTRANLAQSRSGGLELVVNRPLSKTLTLNLTGTTYWNEIDVGSSSFGRNRGGWSVGGRGSLDWQLSPVDLVQVNVIATGQKLTPLGHTEPTWTMNLGYRRKLSERWFLTVTASDIFDSMDRRTVYDTPAYRGYSVSRGSSRGAFIGLRYRFGAAKAQRDPAFDYGSGGGGPTP